MRRRLWLGCVGLAVLAGVLVGPIRAQQAVPGQNPRPGEPGHQTHKEWQGAYPSLDVLGTFKVVKAFAPPDGFIGNLTFDRASHRLWLVSLGPPTNTKGTSMVYELDPDTGKVLAQAPLPLKGDFGEPVYIDGYLYQGVFHESKLYKIAAGDRRELGKIVSVIPLPTLNDLKLGDEAHPVPYIEFGGVTATPDKNLMIHADDVGELITLERDTGRILSRVRTLKALGGIAAVPTGSDFFVLGNSDPRGGYCALSFPPALSRTPDQRDMSWALLDPRSGEVLASIRTQNSPAYASTIELMDYQPIPGTFGRLRFLATGEDGILTLEWTPSRDAY
jgi:hypothetical protein